MRGCFGYWKIQIGPSVFHIDPFHGLIWPRCKGQFSPKFWYQNSPISIGLNWPQKQYRSGLTLFGPIFGAELALFILQCSYKLRRSNDFSLVRYHSELGRNSIRYRGPIVWNSIPKFIRNVTSLQLFKEKLKLA